MEYLWFFLACLCGYLLGSIPFALVIGKVFYHKDIRQYGSGNPGGTNAGRVLGKKAGVSVIALDALKVVLAIYIGSLVSNPCAMLAGFMTCVGHCYPIFAHFKGGKAVASMFGFLLGITIFVFKNPFYIIVPLLMFFIVLYLYKWVSVASICAAVSSSLQIMSMGWSTDLEHILVIVFSWLLTLLVIYRHRTNIVKVRQNKESRITWL
ncbi:glycerol-3-phosphate 1-O-acyltransferase PlsY [Allobaculum stercoricanis]|uniref:glycerol-3-phosphate 1-O-acyltransferase PlsY n=1 Tax=Allobaculum stercoricanis TaxID=174709 RepID=UPI0029422CA5|nr:glycerol-3-phosphate 1-O-acyltransferase PlsY [Allobaculum stercoricanis]